MKLLGRIAKHAAPVFGLLSALSERDGAVASELYSRATGEIIAALDSDDLHALLIELAEMCTIEREPLIVDGNVSDLGEVIETALWAAECQLGPFLRGGALQRAGSRFIGMVTGAVV